MSEQKPLIYGIIHIGSSNLSLRIVEYKNVNEVRVIESVRKDTNFGEEVFNHKNLSFASIRKLCRMLNGLKQLLSDYQVKVYAAYATAVFREADNCRSILDLIRVKTGFNVQVVDMPQEIYFKHFGLSYQLKQYNRAANECLGKNFLFVDITSGCVGLTVWEKGSLCYQHNVHIGTLRLLETFTTNQRESRYFPEALAEYIHAIMEPLWVSIRKYDIDTVVLSGREARIVAMLLHHDLNAIPVKHVVMMGMTFVRSASLFYGAQKTNDPALAYMRAQNLELTRSIAADYYYEPVHAKAMELYSKVIVQAFDRGNGLNDRDEFLLRMAIILYQIGKYVNLLGSSMQAWNMVRGTDIFGISDREKDIVACIVYYDHKGIPNDDDEPFRILSDESKMTALKLISIFRLVRAMDMSRKQKLKDLSAHISGDALVIEYESSEDTALETWLFNKEKTMFETVFGMEAKLERR